MSPNTANGHIVRRGDHEPVRLMSPNTLTIEPRPLDRRRRRTRSLAALLLVRGSDGVVIVHPRTLTFNLGGSSDPSTPGAEETAVARHTPPPNAIDLSSAKQVSSEATVTPLPPSSWFGARRGNDRRVGPEPSHPICWVPNPTRSSLSVATTKRPLPPPCRPLPCRGAQAPMPSIRSPHKLSKGFELGARPQHLFRTLRRESPANTRHNESPQPATDHCRRNETDLRAAA